MSFRGLFLSNGSFRIFVLQSISGGFVANGLLSFIVHIFRYLLHHLFGLEVFLLHGDGELQTCP